MNRVGQMDCMLQECTQMVPSVLQSCNPFDMKRTSIELYKNTKCCQHWFSYCTISHRVRSEEHQLLHIDLKTYPSSDTTHSSILLEHRQSDLILPPRATMSPSISSTQAHQGSTMR